MKFSQSAFGFTALPTATFVGLTATVRSHGILGTSPGGKRMRLTHCLAAMFAFAVCFALPSQAQQTDGAPQTEFNARDEFALTQGGTSGVWNYGFSNSATDNTFNALPQTRTTTPCGGDNPIEEWYRTGEPFDLPSIRRNAGATRCLFTPELLVLHPSDSGRRAVLRWTAPTAGTFLLNGVFTGEDNTTTDAKILKNAAIAGEATLFSGNVIGRNSQQPFNFTVTVAAGDTIDFSVGFGTNSEEFDSTGLAVTIGQPVTACQTAPADLQVFVPGENSPSDVQSVNTNASLVGDANYTNAGKVGRAFNFDGAGDYVHVEDNAVQKPVNQLTVEGWFKFNDFNNFPHLVAKPRRGNVFDSYALWYNGGIRIGYQQDGGDFVELATGFTPQTGVFNHYAFVLNTDDAGATANTAKLFVNGVEVFSGTAGSPILYDATNVYPLLVGADFESDTPTYFLNGQADEVSIYSRALTQPEIFNIVKQDSFGKCPPTNCTEVPDNLVSWYQAENNALDSRSNNHGTFTNAAYANGKSGQAFNFNGTDTFVAAPDDNSLDITNDLTIETWIRPTSYNPDGSVIVAKRDVNNSNVTYVLFLESGGQLTFSSQQNGGGFIPLSTVSAIPLNQFSHIAVTFQGSTARIYVDGVQQAVNSSYPTRTASSGRLTIGTTEAAGCGGSGQCGFFPGQIDELSIYNRALSLAEIQSIINAGQSGKCKPSPLNPPANQIAWFTGDGETEDFIGLNPAGILRGDANYRVGRVAQSFNFDGNGDYVEIADNPNQRPTSQLTIEGWFKFNSLGANSLVSKPFTNSAANSYTLFIENSRIQGGYGTTSTFVRNDTGVVPRVGEWYHLAYTINPGANTHTVYINGQAFVQNSSQALTYEATPGSLLIGAEFEGNSTPTFFLNGQADEISLDDRALSASEIAAIYNAGVAGKRKAEFIAGAPPNGSADYDLTDVTITVPANTGAGEISENGIDLALLPPLPANVSTFTGLAYDVSTTAGFTGSPRVCFNVPSLAARFSELRVLHLEGGVWRDRTDTNNTSPNLCTIGLTSLSPFALVFSPLPTADTIDISGRVTTANGAGIGGVTVTLEGTSSGHTTTDAQGHFVFDNLDATGFYAVGVARRGYTFDRPTQSVNPAARSATVHFVGAPQRQLRGRGTRLKSK